MRIEGAITRGSRQKVTQRPREDLASLLTTLLEQPNVEAVSWRQYTPYFNDGDECIFSVHSPAIRLIDLNETAGDDGDGWIASWDSEYGRLVGGDRWDGTAWVGQEAPNPALHEAFSNLERAVESGAFDEALLDLFGDHCKVTIRKGQNIEIEFYDHD